MNPSVLPIARQPTAAAPARWRSIASLLTVSAGLAACATPQVDAEWTSPQLTGTPLRGKVLVVCEATEVVLSRVCSDRVAADLRARGATVILVPDAPAAAPAAAPSSEPRDDGRYLATARAAGANAVWATSVGPEAYVAEPGSSVSFSIGGFGFGRGGGGGAGVGVAAPLGPGSANAQYAANARVTEVGSGSLLWTARVGAPPGGDAQSQIGNLMGRLVDAAGKSKLY